MTDPELLPPQHSFSLIIPARKETREVMSATLECLLAQDHPDFEVLFSLGHDDSATIAIADQLAAGAQERGYSVRVIVDHSVPKNKPKQLNTTLPYCTKEIVGIFDAESLAAPGVLLRIDQCFTSHEADAVQGAVQLVNYRDRWFTLRNCLEYRTWFRSRLHGHANAGFIPLGGNTVFIYTSLMESIGGWDGDCLAEDCDLGIRLSVRKKKVVVAYDPSLVTREETPATIGEMIKQRTRWSLGFMQVLAKGDWKRLPTRRERFLAWWTLVQQHMMAFTGVSFIFMIGMVFWSGLPLWISFLSFLPAIPLILMVATEIVILHEFGQDLNFQIRIRDYLKMIFSTPLYQMILATAALRAMKKYIKKDFKWERTKHAGTHLTSATSNSETVKVN